MSTPNRLEENWHKIKPLLLEEWKQLSEYDLDASACEFDKIVTLIRHSYGGRVEIIQEASIRDRIGEILASIE